MAQQAASPAPSVAPERPGGAMHYVGLPVLLGGAAFDTLSTLDALQRHGVREANPIIGSNLPLGMALKLIANALLGYTADKAYHKGSKWALPLTIGAGGAQIGAGIHNLRQGRE